MPRQSDQLRGCLIRHSRLAMLPDLSRLTLTWQAVMSRLACWVACASGMS